MKVRLLTAGLLTGLLSGSALAGVAGFATSVMMPGTAQAEAQEALRPAVGKPLQQAQAALRKKAFPQAMAAVNAADAVSGKSAYESYVIAQMRAAVAQSSGNATESIAADDVLIASSRTPGPEKVRLLMAEAGLAYTAHDYPRSITALQRYFKAGGTDASMQTLLIQAYYLQKDYPNAAKAQASQIAAEVKAGQKPAENQLNLLAAVQQQSNDLDGFNATMVKLVQYYPKPQYWAQLVHGLRTNPNIPERLLYDVDRIRLAVGLLTSTADLMDMTELAVQAGYPALAQQVMAFGYAGGGLGKDAGAAREARLKALVDQTAAAKKASLPTDEKAAQAASSGDALLAVGYNYVSFGQADHGLALMQAGIARGKLVSEDDAKLHLGLAYMDAGRKPDAIKVLKTVGGTDGAAQLAELWILQIGKK
ncbi:hypothetical protein [Lichenicola cladoniae]|uniref:hypothetical protein n=1 Tax=Lichenicola cladoniae TaxID=1484109 RepID=UPI001EF52D5E|nr:hypothetical protein [Lichenicola cladoniae]